MTPPSTTVLWLQDRSIHHPDWRGSTRFTDLLAHGAAGIPGYRSVVMSMSSEGHRPSVHGDDGVLYLELPKSVTTVADAQKAFANFLSGGLVVDGYDRSRLQSETGPISDVVLEANWVVLDAFQVARAAGPTVRSIRQLVYHVQPAWVHSGALAPYRNSAVPFVGISDYTLGRLTSEFGIRRTQKVGIGPTAYPLASPVPTPPIDPPRLIWVGANSPEKRPELAIAVLRQLVRVKPATHLDMLGRDTENLAAGNEDLIRSGQLRLHGSFPTSAEGEARKAELMASATALIGTSRADCEGFGLVITEMAAYGRPSIVVPGGGMEEAVRMTAGRYARERIAPNDTPEGIASTVLEMLRQMSIEGARVVPATMSWRQVAAGAMAGVETTPIGPARRFLTEMTRSRGQATLV